MSITHGTPCLDSIRHSGHHSHRLKLESEAEWLHLALPRYEQSTLNGINPLPEEAP